MNTVVGDEVAILFAASFYQTIGFGRSVQEGDGAAVAAGINPMNRDEALELLGGGRGGVLDWNERRSANEVIPVLRDAALGECDLRQANLGGADLSAADLRESNLGGTKTRSTHFLIAIVDGIAERTPKRRAS